MRRIGNMWAVAYYDQSDHFINALIECLKEERGI